MKPQSHPFKFVGTGGVFDFKYGNSSLVIDIPQKILIDIGPLVYPRIVETGIIDSIDFLLLTHLHGDHIGGIFQYIFHNKGKLDRRAKIIFQNSDFKDEIVNLLDAMSIPKTHYELVPISEFSQITVIDTTNKHAEGVTSFGFVFTLTDQVVYYSGDLGDIEVSNQVLQNLSPEHTTVLHELHHKGGKAHVNYAELEDICDKFEVYGYHCNPELMPEDNKVPLACQAPEILL